jgi:spartin
MSTPEAFLLLTLENATVTTSTFTQSGTLGLECVSVQIPEASAAVDRDVYLILRLGSVETPIDPAMVIHRTDGHGWRKYTFHSTEVDLTQMNVTFSLPADQKSSSVFMEDLETFDSILAQYADLQGLPDSAGQTTDGVGGSNVIGPGFPGGHGDLRGHLVVIDEETGEVVGQFDDSKFNIQEDPKLQQRGHEDDAVIIEIPDTNTVQEDEGRTPMEMFVRTVPTDQQDLITKSATLIRYF